VLLLGREQEAMVLELERPTWKPHLGVCVASNDTVFDHIRSGDYIEGTAAIIAPLLD
jgi:hypothetical protein